MSGCPYDDSNFCQGKCPHPCRNCTQRRKAQLHNPPQRRFSNTNNNAEDHPERSKSHENNAQAMDDGLRWNRYLNEHMLGLISPMSSDGEDPPVGVAPAKINTEVAEIDGTQAILLPLNEACALQELPQLDPDLIKDFFKEREKKVETESESEPLVHEARNSKRIKGESSGCEQNDSKKKRICNKPENANAQFDLDSNKDLSSTPEGTTPMELGSDPEPVIAESQSGGKRLIESRDAKTPNEKSSGLDKEKSNVKAHNGPEISMSFERVPAAPRAASIKRRLMNPPPQIARVQATNQDEGFEELADGISDKTTKVKEGSEESTEEKSKNKVKNVKEESKKPPH